MKKQTIHIKSKYLSTSFFLALLLLPLLSYAAGETAQTFLTDISLFIKNLLLPFLFSIAFLFFLINMVRYFIIEGASETGREKAKRSALYGIAAFVFFVSIWSIVGLFIQGPLKNTEPVCPDYLTDCQ